MTFFKQSHLNTPHHTSPNRPTNNKTKKNMRCSLKNIFFPHWEVDKIPSKTFLASVQAFWILFWLVLSTSCPCERKDDGKFEKKNDVPFGCVSILEKKRRDSRKRTNTLAELMLQSFWILIDPYLDMIPHVNKKEKNKQTTKSNNEKQYPVLF